MSGSSHLPIGGLPCEEAAYRTWYTVLCRLPFLDDGRPKTSRRSKTMPYSE